MQGGAGPVGMRGPFGKPRRRAKVWPDQKPFRIPNYLLRNLSADSYDRRSGHSRWSTG
jgi:hypothetical protein